MTFIWDKNNRALINLGLIVKITVESLLENNEQGVLAPSPTRIIVTGLTPYIDWRKEVIFGIFESRELALDWIGKHIPMDQLGR